MKETYKSRNNFFVKILMMLAVIALPFFVVACEDPYKNMSISLSCGSEVVYVQLDNNNDSEEVVVTVDAPEGVSRDVVASSESSKIALSQEVNEDKTTTITVRALGSCQDVPVTVRTVEGNKTATFYVTVIVSITSMSQTLDSDGLFVVRGQPKVIKTDELLVFTPANTTEKEVTYSLADETLTGVTLENNILTVGELYEFDTVELNAVSVHDESIQTTISLAVLNKLDDVITYAASFSDGENIDLIAPITFAKNIASRNSVTFEITLDTILDVSVTPYLKSTLSQHSPVASISSYEKEINAENQTTKFTFIINADTAAGRDALYFEVKYANFDYKLKTTEFEVASFDVVNGIDFLVNGLNPDSFTFEVYHMYFGTLGLEISASVRPLSVPPSESYLTLTWGLNTADYIFYDQAGNIISQNSPYEFASNAKIYVIARNYNAHDANFIISSKSNPLVSQVFVLTAEAGADSLKFLNDKKDENNLSTYYLTSNNKMQQRIDFSINNGTVDGVSILKSGSGFEVEDVIYQGQNIGEYYFFINSVKGAENSTGTITIKLDNGLFINANVEVFEQLEEENLSFSVSSMQYSASIGQMRTLSDVSFGGITYATEFALSLKNGLSVPLNVNAKGADSISYSFFDYVFESGEDAYSMNYTTFSTFNNEQGMTAEGNYAHSTNIIKSLYLNSFNELYANSVGKTWVKAVVHGYELIGGEKTELSFTFYFMVEVYNPITSFNLDIAAITLYAQNSIAERDFNYSIGNVAVNMNKNATYGKIQWTNNYTYFANGENFMTYTLNGEDIFTFTNLDSSVQVEAFSTLESYEENGEMLYKYADEREFYFVAKVFEFDKIQAISLKVVIKKAEQVEKIEVTNFNAEDGIYLELTYTGEDIVYPIIAKAKMNETGKEPFNSRLVYTFIPELGAADNILQIQDNGTIIVSKNQTIGGKGKIRIAPEDRFVGGVYTPGENDIAVYVDITIADGRSRDTSFRIFNLSEITNPNLHYTIMENEVISSAKDYAILEEFDGGLYGCVKGLSDKKIIKTNKALFIKLGENAVIEDLIVIGEINSSNTGFIANINKGIVRNVTIDTISGTRSYNPSQITSTSTTFVGGIVGENQGLIENALFTGIVIANHASAGGLVGKNLGTIKNSSVEFYNFSNTRYGKVQGKDYVGALVAQMERGLIENCRVTSYVYNAATLENKIVLYGSRTNELVANKLGGEIVDTTANITNISEVLDQIVGVGETLNTTDNIISEGARSVVFYYQTETILSDNERVKFNGFNFISFDEILGYEAKNIRGHSSNSSIISVHPQGIEVCATGIVTLTLFSKYDYSTLKNFTVYVIYPVQEFTLMHDNSEFNSGAISNIKITDGFTLSGQTETSKYLVNREVAYKTNDLVLSILDYRNYISGSGLGSYNFALYNIYKDTGLDRLTINYLLNVSALTGLGSQDLSYVNAIINTKFGGNFAINLYKGSDRIVLSTKEAEIEPNDSLVFYANQYSDLDYNADNGALPIENIEVTGEHIDMFNVQIEYLSSEYYTEFNNLAATTENKSDAVYFNHKYKITLEVKEQHKDKLFQDEKFDIVVISTSAQNNKNEFGAKTVSSNLEVYINSQSVESINISHYNLKSKTLVVENNKNTTHYEYLTEMSSILSPGDEGLLQIDLFPIFAHYDYIDVTYTTNISGNYVLRFGAMQKKAGVFVKDQLGVETTPNGVKIYNNYDRNKSYPNGLNSFYLNTFIPDNITNDVVFMITVSAYDENGQLVSAVVKFNLVVQYLSSAQITLYNDNGEEINTIARGTEGVLKIQIKKDQNWDQTINFGNLVQNSEISNAISYSSFTKEENIYDSTITYTTRLYVGDGVVTVDNSNYFTISVTTSWVINGKLQSKTSSSDIGIVDFLLKGENVTLSTDKSDKTNLNSFIGIQTLLEFDFNIDNPILQGKENIAYAKFLREAYYENLAPTNEFGQFIVNDGNKLNNNFMANLYTVSNGIASQIMRENGTINSSVYGEYFDFNVDSFGNIYVVGKKSGVVDMRLSIPVRLPSSHEIVETIIDFDFTITINVYNDEDVPLIIDSEEAFYNALSSNNPQNYILMTDLFLTEYSPLNTTGIASLDGNNFVINILSYESVVEGATIRHALFNEVSENTTLKNLIVNTYFASNIQIDTTRYNTVEIAGLALTNKGIIYNCHVVSYNSDPNRPNIVGVSGLNVNYSIGQITGDTSSKIAGFVLTNTGSITNSRVGGTNLELLTSGNLALPVFNIAGQGSIAGFVYENSGTISSSFFDNGTITNNTSSGITTFTSGFVGTNRGEINLSYARGVGGNEYSFSEGGISTAGISSGFVYLNTGSIGDSFSNILLTTSNLTTNNFYASGRLTSGFVYSNDGDIARSYTASKIENAKTTQMNFIGVDSFGDMQNTGTIENCYYYNPDSDLDDAYISTSQDIHVVRIEEPDVEDNYYGFSFASSQTSVNGVWYSTSFGIELVSANQTAISSRYIANERRDASTGELISYDLPYASGYEYGSVKNPIIIRNASEFNTVFGGDGLNTDSAIARYIDLNNKIVEGNYRIVSEIDLSSLITDTSSGIKISSTSMTLAAAVVDGNAFTLNGLELVAKSDVNAKNYGMFAGLKNGALVKNVNLKMVEVSAATIQNVGAVAGFVEDSKLINISVSSMAENTVATVVGNNIVGGVVGKIIGDSQIKNISVGNVAVTADNVASSKSQRFNRDETVNSLVNSYVSYAGGVAGVVDIYTKAQKPSLNHVVSAANAQISMVSVSGLSSASASTVGGVVAYLGPNTLLQDATFEASKENECKLISYNLYAGGIVGQCYGNIDMAVAEHSHNTQILIEDKAGQYYKQPAANVERGNLTLFEHNEAGKYKPVAIGGLVGILSSGDIKHSYSKLHVRNNNATYAGGIIGEIPFAEKLENNDIELHEVYAFGDVFAAPTLDDATASGGIAGYIDFNRNLSFTKVNAVNYYSLSVDKDSGEYSLASNTYDIYGMTGSGALNNPQQPKQISQIFDGALLEMKSGFEKYSLPTISCTVGSDEMYAIVNVGYLNNEAFAKTNASYADLGTKTYYKMIDESKQAITLYNYQSNEVSSNEMDSYFRNSDWDPSYWYRYPGEMLPSLVSYSEQMLFYIRVAKDVENIKKYPDATFIVIGNEENDGKVPVGHYMVNNNIEIEGFTGSIRGYNNSGKYGLDFEGQSVTFIKTASPGAKIYNLHIWDLGTSDTSTQEGSRGSFVGEAVQTSLEALTFTNCVLHTTADLNNYNLGLLVNEMEGGIISDVQFVDCAMDVKVADGLTELDELNIGFVIGKVQSFNGTSTQINDVSVYMTNGNINNTASTNSLYNDLDIDINTCKIENLNVGTLAGRVVDSVYVYYTPVSASDGLVKGIGVSNIKGAYDPTTTLDGVENGLVIDVTTSNSTAGSVSNFNGGLMFGKTQLANVTFQRPNSDYKLDIAGAIKTNSLDVDNANVGGLVGNVDNAIYIRNNGEILDKYIRVDCDIKLSATQISGGMLVGKANSVEGMDNLETFGSINAKTINGLAHIGGFIGKTTAYTEVRNCISRTLIKLDSESANYSNVGGIIGYCESSSALKIGNDGYNTKYLGKTAVSATYAHVGGIVGSIAYNPNGNVNISNAVFGGEIYVEDATDLNVGGILGSSLYDQAQDNTSNRAILLSENLAFGDVKIVCQLSDEKIVKVGGIVGRGSVTTAINSNYSLTSIYAPNGLTNQEESINAVVGVLNGSFSGKNGNNDPLYNYYCHQVNLCLESNQVESPAPNQFASRNAYYNKTTVISEINSQEFNFLSWVTNTYIKGTLLPQEQKEETYEGSKLKPYILTSETMSNYVAKLDDTSLTTTKYFVLAEDVLSGFNSKTLKRSFFIGDGYTIENKSTHSIFDFVDDESVVTGIKVKSQAAISTGTEHLLSVGVGGLANVNTGIIYSTNVVEFNNAKTEDIYGVSTNASGAYAGGLVGINYGLIADSFAETDVYGLAVTAGLVGKNLGNIASSYSVGNVESEASDSAFAFAGGNGKVYASYSASMVKSTAKVSSGVFDSNDVIEDAAKGIYSYYDLYSTGVYDSKGVTSTTSVMATPKPLDTDAKPVFLSKSFASAPEDAVADSKFGYEFGKNYGYLTFVGSAYKTLEYMQSTETGDGKNTNPQLIPNIGKLQQINEQLDSSNVNYLLVSDIELTEDMYAYGAEDYGVKYWKSIGQESKAFRGVFNGYNNSQFHTITNALRGEFTDGDYFGLFGYIDNANIINVEILNSDVQSTALDIQKEYVGSVVGHAHNSFVSTVFVDCASYNHTASAETIIGGLVGKASGTTEIKNCMLDDLYVSIAASSKSTVGGVSGTLENSSKINNSCIFNNMELSSENGEMIAGGVVGIANGSSEIINIEVDSNDYIYTSGINASLTYGALGGKLDGVTITDVVVSAYKYVEHYSDISGENAVGYLAGSVNRVTVSGTNSLTGEFDVYVGSSGTNSYYGGVVGKVTGGLAELMKISDAKEETWIDVDAGSGVNMIGGYAGSIIGEDFVSESVFNITSAEIEFNENSSVVNYIGGAVGLMQGGNVENISVDYANIDNYSSATSGNNSSAIGALIGRITGSDAQTISNVSANGNLTLNKGKIGGLIGQNACTDLTITDISSVASIVTLDIDGSAGGIVGANSGKLTIDNNNNGLNYISVGGDGVGKIGGLVGENTSNITIKDVRVNDNIDLEADSGSYIGGIIGASGPTATIENVKLFETVTFSVNDKEGLRIGGAVGTGGDNLTLEDVAITDIAGFTIEGGEFGGLVAVTSGDTTITDCDVTLSQTISITDYGFLAGGVAVVNSDITVNGLYIIASKLEINQGRVAGVFAYTSSFDSDLQDITVSNSHIVASDATGISGMFASLHGNLTNFKNISLSSTTVQDNSTDSNNNGFGLIASSVTASLDLNNSSNISVSSCNLKSESQEIVGGMFGQINGAFKVSDLQLDYNTNLDVSGFTTFGYIVGSISGTSEDRAVISGATNNNSITTLTPSTSESGVLEVGGIAGYVGSNALISEAVNNGYISPSVADCNFDYLAIGGIAGYAAGTDDNNAYFTLCENNGSISITASGLGVLDALAYAGGIVGEAYNARFTSCENSVSINICDSGNLHDSQQWLYGGGICAYAENSGFTGCENSGDISVGGNQGNLNLTHSYIKAMFGGESGAASDTFMADGTAEAYAGGIVGEAKNSNAGMCTNSGDITAKALIEVVIDGNASYMLGDGGPLAGYDCEVYYGTQTEYAYANGIGYFSGTATIGGGNSNSGVIIGGEDIEFNIFYSNLGVDNIDFHFLDYGHTASGAPYDAWEYLDGNPLSGVAASGKFNDADLEKVTISSYQNKYFAHSTYTDSQKMGDYGIYNLNVGSAISAIKKAFDNSIYTYKDDAGGNGYVTIGTL